MQIYSDNLDAVGLVAYASFKMAIWLFIVIVSNLIVSLSLCSYEFFLHLMILGTKGGLAEIKHVWLSSLVLLVNI